MLETFSKKLFSKKNTIPLIKIFDREQKLHDCQYNHEFWDIATQFPYWQDFIAYQIECSFVLLDKEHEHKVIIGPNKMIFGIKSIQVEEETFGIIFFGGWRLSKVNYNIDFTPVLPPEISKEDFFITSSEFSKKVNTLLPFKEKLFVSILETLKNESSTLFTIRTLAEKYNCSQSYIRRLFLRNTGKTFSDFYTELKLDKALKLRKESLLSVKEVSMALGYSDARSFCRKLEEIEKTKSI